MKSLKNFYYLVILATILTLFIHCSDTNLLETKTFNPNPSENTVPEAEFTYTVSLLRNIRDTVIIDSNTSNDVDPGDTISYKWFINSKHFSEYDDVKLPKFSLSKFGYYVVKLRVTDNHGAYSEKALQIEWPQR